MAFRFKVDKLVLPMRLSAYNKGEMHNVVYLLTDGPRRIRSIPEEYVVRLLTGEELFRDVTQPLPLRIIGGTEKDIPDWQRQSLPQQRDPTPHNGQAKELFGSDLLAVKMVRLSHQYEEDEKMLLRIGEHVGLRGPEIDKENLAALAKERDKAVKSALEDMKKMTLTAARLAGQATAAHRCAASRTPRRARQASRARRTAEALERLYLARTQITDEGMQG